MVKRSCDMRYKIVHGRWDNDPALDSVMFETEAIIRTAFRVIADDPKLLTRFATPHRDHQRTSPRFFCDTPKLEFVADALKGTFTNENLKSQEYP